MRKGIAAARSYCVVILKATSKRKEPGVEKIIWEHGRRNFGLRADGIMPIVCPVNDGSEVSGVAIFTTSVEETKKIMDEDPGVKAGVFTYEVHACRSFPGSSLPHHVAKAAITIRAGTDKVWDALTNPDLIRKYLYGTEAHSDWKKGSPITYKGVWQGKAYEDKGVILEIVPGQQLVSTYWSSMSGLPDTPEHYNTVTYELSHSKGDTTLTVTQDNNASKESADHSASNWTMVLQALKALLEK